MNSHVKPMTLIKEIDFGTPDVESHTMVTLEIDGRERLVLPGGVDPHCHIEQLSAAGIMNADTFASATASAAFGGTTTVISFDGADTSAPFAARTRTR